jgi:hypothetical protein
LGSACRDYHGNVDIQKNYRYKEKLCENYALGKCEKGNVCIFIHSDPKADQIEADIDDRNGVACL